MLTDLSKLSLHPFESLHLLLVGSYQKSETILFLLELLLAFLLF